MVKFTSEVCYFEEKEEIEEEKLETEYFKCNCCNRWKPFKAMSKYFSICWDCVPRSGLR